jgi:hypothetical protein
MSQAPTPNSASTLFVYFLQRKSPDKAAQDLWDVVTPSHDELPKLCTSSDIT